MKVTVSLVQFTLLCLENSLIFSLWCVKQLKLFTEKIAFVIDNLPYAGIPIAKQEKVIEAQVEEIKPQIRVEFFDFKSLKNSPDQFPHLRVIGKTGVGKTRLTEWLMDLLEGEQFVITPKKKPNDWANHRVYGYPFNYPEIEEQLNKIHSLMYQRYADMEKGIQPHMINFAADEWKLTNKNVDSAKETMKDIIIVARDAKIRLVALAQGENVKTWGLEGESDLEECFTSIRLGEFAKDHCKMIRNKYRKDSEEFLYYEAVLSELDNQGFRCCMVDNKPAIIPNLSNWKPTFKSTTDSFNSDNHKVTNKQLNGYNSNNCKPAKTDVKLSISEEITTKNFESERLKNAIKNAISEGYSVDWCVKNISGLTGSYYSKREIVHEIVSNLD